MITYEKPGNINTEETLKIALSAATERNLDIVVATSTGKTAIRLAELAKENGFTGKIIAVTLAYGMAKAANNKEITASLKSKGIEVVTAAHSLSGGERSLLQKFQGVYPLELIAYTLRIFSQGIKVAVEISLMATDSGHITIGDSVVAVAGTSDGADTACIITPSNTANLLDTKVHEILCKPY